MANDLARLDEVFTAAVAETVPGARAAYLNQACHDNPNLRERVEALLAAHDGAGSLLDLPNGEATTPFISLSERPGTTISRYKLLEQIGEGGFGVVFMAEQEQPVRRRVALKVIKLGMDTKQVVARFEAERQALALMDHPNIAKVFDAGSTDTGRPYFVMELVRGVPITEYCDQARLSTNDRLALFQLVCSAVQHAHQKGIIHRDLKPSNVLVTLHDDKAVPKVIDFGVAKATQARLTERTLFTEFRQMVGTPAYMSPEQAHMSGLDADTRSDVYSLGVLLYELLTGTTPIELKKISNVTYDELRKLICEVEPPSPSARLSTLTPEALTTLANKRHCAPTELTVSLRSDLDWIVMKCLEKDRSRRYESASNLALDVQRYLDGEPIEARPPTAAYRLRKFVRRNRSVVVAGSLIATALLAGISIATWQAVRALRAEKVAEAAAGAEAQAKEAAEERQAEMQAVLDFVEGKVFAAARPEGQAGGLGREVSLRAAVEAALPYVETSFTKQPLIEARLRRTLGQSFFYLGEERIAEAQFQAARDLYTKQLGKDHPATLASMHGLAASYYGLGRYDEALRLNEETLAAREAVLGPDHPDTLTTVHEVARCYFILGRHTDAVKLNEENLALRKAVLGPGHPDTINSMYALASGYDAFVRIAKVLALREEVVALRKTTVGSDHPDTIASMSDLANSYFTHGRYNEALKLHEETLAAAKAKFGSDHSTTILSMIDLANCYRAVGRPDHALPLHEEALTLVKTKFGPEHPLTFHGMINLANSYAALGRIADAEALMPAVPPPSLADQPQYVSNVFQMRAELQARLGRWQEAAASLQKVAEVEPDRHWTYFQLAAALVQVGESAAYHDHCARTLQQFGQLAGPYLAERLVKFSLILPWPEADYQALSDLADVALNVDPSHDGLPFFEYAKGLLEYRQGNFVSAASQMEKVLEAPASVSFRHAEATMVLALAQLKMNQFEKAHATFERGNDYILTHITKLDTTYFNDNSWPDVIIVYALQREAVELAGEILAQQNEDLGSEHLVAIQAHRDVKSSKIRDLVNKYVAVGRITDAEALLAENLSSIPKDTTVYASWLEYRGYLRGWLGRWQDATADFSRLVEIKPDRSWGFCQLAALLAHSGDPVTYHELGGQMLRRFNETDDHYVAHEVTKFSLILPWPEADYQMLSDLADFALNVDPSHDGLPIFQCTKGLVEFRQGNFTAAAEWMEKALDAPSLHYHHAQAAMVLAMARLKTNQFDAARDAFAQGSEYIRQHVPKLDADKIGPNWVDPIIVYALQREAVELAAETLAQQKATLGPEHPDVLKLASYATLVYAIVGQNADARRLLEEIQASLGREHRPAIQAERDLTYWSIRDLAESHVAHGRIADAEMLLANELSQDLEDRPGYASLLMYRGYLRARLGLWPKAMADYSKVLELNPDDQWPFYMLASLLVQTDEIEAYRDQCTRALQQFAQTDNPNIAERTVKACLILPWPEADFQTLSNLANVALNVDPSHHELPYFEFAKGLAEFRQGNFATAVEWMKKVLAVSSYPPRHAQAYMVLAMAQQGSGERAVARETFQQGSEYIRTHLPPFDAADLGGGWFDVIIAYTLEREARAMLGLDEP